MFPFVPLFFEPPLPVPETVVWPDWPAVPELPEPELPEDVPADEPVFLDEVSYKIFPADSQVIFPA